MKKFLTTLALAAAVTAPTFGQEITRSAVDRGSDISTMTDDEKFERVVNSYMDVKFRSNAINYLGLNEEEIVDFDPILIRYSSAADAIEAKRKRLVEDYNEEMAEDDTAQDEENETADFIENYWEIDIDKMELKKDYFDILEDVIGTQKALAFFAYEESVANRINRIRMMRVMPMLMTVEPGFVSYQGKVDDFNNWKHVNIDGKVGLDHEFTSTGLEKLVSTVKTMAMAEGINVPDLEQRASDITMNGDKLTEDWTSLSHADYARKAFTSTAKLLGDVANNGSFSINNSNMMQLEQAAKAIKPGVKLTEQADAVYNFFDTAESVVNSLVDQARSGENLERQMKSDWK